MEAATPNGISTPEKTAGITSPAETPGPSVTPNEDEEDARLSDPTKNTAPPDRELVEREIENNRFSESFDSKRALNSSPARPAKQTSSKKLREPVEMKDLGESQGDEIEHESLASSARRVVLILLCIFFPCIGIPVAILEPRDQKWRLTRDGILHRWTRSRTLHWCSDWRPDLQAPTKIRLTEPFTLDDYSNLHLALEVGGQTQIPLPPEAAPVILDRWNTWRGITPGVMA